MRFSWKLPLIVLALAAVTSAPAWTAPEAAKDVSFWTGDLTPDALAGEADAHLARAQKALDALLAVKGKRTIDNTLAPFDLIQREVWNANGPAGLIENVHPDSALRATAEEVDRKTSAFATALSLNRGLYDALAALNLDGADPETRFYVQRTLLEFRLSGVDKDEATRAAIKQLNDALVETGQTFSRNIRSGGRTVTVSSADELAGLPQDYIDRHKPAADGSITLTTDYPDALPVYDYASNGDLRRRMYMAFNTRAYPENQAVLDSMLAQRWRLARLLGFDNWADCVTADKMVGSAKNASDFIDRILEAAKPVAAREYDALLARKRQDDPSATAVNAWDASYYSELVRKERYDFDSQAIRPYLQYDRVKQGVLDVTSKLFGVEFRRVKDAPVWDPSVECYELYDGGKLAGRFYLDMHPRANKYKHAASFRVRPGEEGVQIPEGVLVCNFSGGEAGDPGLMDFSEVTTFFHEFGHLLHNMFSGHHRWFGVAGTSAERDFVEAPSQMLEEWPRTYAVLSTFAKHYETGETVPAEMVEQMRRADNYGKGLRVQRQMVYARTSLSFYDRDPAHVDTDRMIREITERYQPYKFVDGTHFQDAFGHLDGYSAIYYTYMWSLVIAKDMFSAFDGKDPMQPDVARRYRDAVLVPGSSAPAAKLVENFLGRPFGFDSYKAWLNEGAGAN